MSLDATVMRRMEEDRVSNVLKWVLLTVAVITFGLLASPTALHRPNQIDSGPTAPF